MKVIGGILIILGTSIGAGMLALPVATAHEGFLLSALFMVITWMLMTIGAFLILEVNLWLPENSNLISMAGLTLGRVGQTITWVIYLLLLYTLLCAYISGNSDVLQGLLAAMHIDIPRWLDTLIVVMLFAAIVYQGIYSVDIVNRILMGSKIVIYLLMVVLIAPHIKFNWLASGDHKIRLATIMVIITSFGYAIIVPSLRSYFNSDIKQLRKVIFIGSLVPLVFYIVWLAIVQGVISLPDLRAVAKSSHAITDLVLLLNHSLNIKWLSLFSRVFISICAATSFLGVSLCLFDFLADGIKLRKKGHDGLLVAVTTFVPPLVVIIFAPGAFILALQYAGIFVVILLMLLPAVMAWRGRYINEIDGSYRMIGGKALLATQIVISLLLLGWILLTV
jgi:tyrosine-specific transport protein